jgi:hypothetical protein
MGKSVIIPPPEGDLRAFRSTLNTRCSRHFFGLIIALTAIFLLSLANTVDPTDLASAKVSSNIRPVPNLNSTVKLEFYEVLRNL